MDNAEKELLESLKNLDLKKVHTKNSYAELYYKGSLRQLYITDIDKEEDQAEIYINSSSGNASIGILNFFGENISEENIIRNNFLTPVNELSGNVFFDILGKLNSFNIKLEDDTKQKQYMKLRGNKNFNNKYLIEDKNGKKIDISGYKLYQFLIGYLLDILVYLKNCIFNKGFEEEQKEVFLIILDIVEYLAQEVQKNLSKYKNAYFNRKLLIVSKISAILISFDTIIYNFIDILHFNYKNIIEIELKFTHISNIIYKIIMSINEETLIPWPCIKNIMLFISNSGSQRRIKDYKKAEIFRKFNLELENLNELEIKNIKRNSDMRENCENIISELYGPTYESLVDKSYYSFLSSCLKSKNLETRMNSLNELTDMINSFDDESQKKHKSFREFITKNNVLEIIFEEGIHDEIIKRSFGLFVYFAKNKILDDKYLEKIIERQKNNKLFIKLLIQIIKVLPKDKKDSLFLRLSKDVKFNHKSNNEIEFISELTEVCFNKPKEKKEEAKKEANLENKEKVNDEKINYYGLNMIYDYITKDFDDKIKSEENNVDFAIDSFKNIIFKALYLNHIKPDDVFYFVEQLFDNIKSNNKHNSVIQSIKLIQFLMDFLKGKKNCDNLLINLRNLNKKYNIISLLIDDLVRYLQLLPKDYKEDEIYEGIYTHKINIEQRIKLVFYFFKKIWDNSGLDLVENKYIEKLYQILKDDKYKEEKRIFYDIFTKNIKEIDDKILSDFFTDIIENKSEFNIETINSKTINFITKIFKIINLNKKSIYDDGRTIRVDGGVAIEGFDLLFNFLTMNNDKDAKNKISDLLCTICINFKDYTSEEIPNYWQRYYSKINLYLDNISKTDNKIAFNGIIKLLNKIYSFTCNCSGKIPKEEDYHHSPGQIRKYNFKNIKGKKYYLKATSNDSILEMRWKLGYFYDIPINNVTFVGADNKKYSINNDFDNFIEVFSDERYLGENGDIIKVINEPFQFLQIKNNPKDFIENNQNLYKILIKNLKIEAKKEENDIEIESKQKIWNILSKLPKNYFFKNNLIKFGNKEKIDEKEILEIFDVKEIYLFTYSLQCFNFYLFEKKDEKKEDKKEEIEDSTSTDKIPDKDEFLNNFINVHFIDKYILEALLNLKIEKQNCKPIDIECISIIINVLNEFQNYKIKSKEILVKKELYEQIIKKLTEIISELMEFNFIKYKNYLDQINDDTTEIQKASSSNNKSKSNNDSNINEIIAKLIKKIFGFIEVISKDNVPYMEYMFNNIELFKQIFVEDYIKSETDELKKVIEDYLSKNFGNNNEYIRKYLEIILTVDIFNYLVKNDEAGKYFHVITSLMKQCEQSLNKNDDNKNGKEENDKEKEENKKENNKEKVEYQFYKQSKEIIDIILDYIQKESGKKDTKKDEKTNMEIKKLIQNKEDFKEGILLFLTHLIKLNQGELVQYIINKIDIFELFINKCLLSKCTEKPLEAKEPFCLTNKSQNPVYNLIIILLKLNDANLYNKIIDFLNEYHKKGFWKTYHHKNWELDSKEMHKGKYVGLKNMASTCYLNSIIQQLFMIPMFRETILKIENSSKTNVLYELQLLFSALKIYEFAYYDPVSFVVINKLNFHEQMDADEFYGSLIDKIENDIKKLYSTDSTPPTGDEKNTPKDAKETNYKYKNIFNYFFGIKVLDELKFVDCGHKRYNEFCYNSIQLEIKGCDNIYDSLKNYFKTEIMDGDNKINCEKCNIKRTCHKHLIFKSLPNILVVILKRFEFDYNTMLKYKLNKYFEFPFKLDMKDYLIEDHTETNTEYELRGITIHDGVADFGHYYDLIKGPDGKWYKFNDINVSEFKEEDIPEEAYGEKEIMEEEGSKDEETGKNNAYILIYKKIDFDKNEVEKQIKDDLALPPYSLYSNINTDLLNEINNKLYQAWTIKSIASPSYQNFIISLLKFDIAKKMNSELKDKFRSLFKLLKEEKYILEENDDNNDNNNSENKIIIKEENSNDMKIYEFALRYFFSVYIRISKKCRDEKRTELFKNIIRFYILSDIKRAKYFLEEFSNNEVIDEYLIYCPLLERSKICLDIIVEAYKFIFDQSDKEENEIFVKEFMNTIITYIDNNIKKVSLEILNLLFKEILNIGGLKFKAFLKKKRFDEWIKSFTGNENKNYKNVINPNSYPCLASNHCILSEKNKEYGKMNDEVGDIFEMQFRKKLHDNKPNTLLLHHLVNIFL